jgi:hypothetical protein
VVVVVVSSSSSSSSSIMIFIINVPSQHLKSQLQNEQVNKNIADRQKHENNKQSQFKAENGEKTPIYIYTRNKIIRTIRTRNTTPTNNTA